LDWVRLLESVPRHRRVVIDCDGAYNDPIEYGGDYNHLDQASSRHWIAVCDSLADKIFQPTRRPRRANVRPFLFHIYDPTWEAPLTFADKEFSMIYVGHTKFRWRGMSKVLQAIERVRDRVGRVALVGEGWAEPEDWMEHPEHKPRYFVDRDYLKRVGAEALPAVPYQQVAETINKGVFNPVVYRPLFEHLGLVTCRTFETPAAGTIPLFLLERSYVIEIFGEAATHLMLDEENAHEKIIDVLERPQRYADIVMAIRQNFRREHSPEARLRELVGLIEA
jgi:glycosyltransferase involved in cell wall biosynthesis